MEMNVNPASSLVMNLSQLNVSGNSIDVKPVAEDAAGYAIGEKITAQETGLNKGSDNTADMNNLLKTAEGGLSNITDNLQRIQELTIQANSGMLTSDDKSIIQGEVDQILDSIRDTINSTEFNNQKLLDGSFNDRNTASGADGLGMNVSIGDMTIEALGLDDFNVSDPTALDTIESALNTVVSQRSNIGAMSNTFEHTINSNDIMSLNLAASRSRVVDTDVAKVVTESKKEETLQQYRLAMQASEMDQQQSIMNTLMP